MKPKSRHHHAPIALCLAALVVWAAGPQAESNSSPEDSPDPARASTRYALLIGINEYVTDDYPDLRGARNDVDTMREILVTRFGFDPAHVTLLADRQATRRGILAALDRLVTQTDENDVVYIHFSGHGSQVEDLDGDESDGKDETLLPHDARTAGVPDITDDELGAFLARLPAQTAVITLDSCHSGTATRGSFLTRSVPPDTRLELYRKAALTPRTIVAFERSERHVLMTGAAAHQFALDGPADGRLHGFFTYALSQSLQAIGPGATPNDLHPEIRRTFDRFSDKYGIPVPEPQIEATADRLSKPLFGTLAESATRPWGTVQPTAAASARLVKGATLNARPGSLWAIYPPGETDFAPGEAIALGTVVAVEGDDALLRVETSGATLSAGFRAALAAPATTDEIIVRISGLDAEMARALETAILRRAPDVTFVGGDAFANFDIACSSQATCTLRDAAGATVLDRFSTPELARAAARLGARFDRALNAASLLALANPLSDLRLDVALVGPGPQVPRRVRLPDAPLTHDNSLMLEVRANRDCYLTIVDVDAEGGINVLFPTPHAEPGFLPGGFVSAGRKVRIPDSLDADNAAGFHWPFAAPAGIDTIQVFATTDRRTADAIRDRIAASNAPTARGTGEAGGRPRNLLGELRTHLASRILRRGASDEISSTPSAGDWTTASARVRIVE